MSIDNVMKFISEQASKRPSVRGRTSQAVSSSVSIASDQEIFRLANEKALDEVAKYATALVKAKLSRPYDGVSSAPGESPKQRTGTLRDSIHWRRSQASRAFPGSKSSDLSKNGKVSFKSMGREKYMWYKRIKKEAYEDNKIIDPYPVSPSPNNLVRVIEVDPSAADRSDRSRLEYYSYYLETGWYSKSNQQFRDKGNPRGSKNEVPRAVPASPRDGSGWNPPRPYLSLLTSPSIKSSMEILYQSSLARELPRHLRSMAYKARLTVKYNRSLRVPYISENKGLLE